jgi:ribonuclease P/MRP protein subunit RPP40
VGRAKSAWAPVQSGVPQGSVLGPLLFLIFIADLGSDLGPGGSALLKYVDDTKLVREVSNSEEVEALQSDLEQLYKWQASNNMEWNATKFQVLRMGSNLPLKEITMLFTPDFGNPIEETPVVKDLGVQMDQWGSFKVQRAKANKKTLQKAGWVLRVFKSRDMGFLRTLWKSLVRPHQDYASQLWAPVGLVGDLAAQEVPLRSLSRRMGGMRGLNYWERLAKARLLSSERRQERYRIIYSWKVLQGLVPNCGLSLDSIPDSRRGRTLAIPPLTGSVRAIRSMKESAFQTEGPRLFNSLPREVRNIKGCLQTFKSHLDAFLETVPDQPATPGLVPGAQKLSGAPSNSVRDWVKKIF